MIELIIIIVVVGILSVVVMPRMEKDSLRDAANQVLRHIRYAQHLAMVDDVYNDQDTNWYRDMWKITFRTANNCYTVYSDADDDYQADEDEAAVDPFTRTLLYADSGCTVDSARTTALLLEDEYGIDSITLAKPVAATANANDCSTATKKYIAFDNLGRPHTGVSTPTGGLMVNPCEITISSGSRSAVITVQPETGYAEITSVD
jgi:Tfp pilus assembly protein FimT